MEIDQNQKQNSKSFEGEEKMVVRPFECNFCKRGFSSAQALGGHMNIHRKDKAKLKHSPKQNLPKSKPPYCNITKSGKWPWVDFSNKNLGNKLSHDHYDHVIYACSNNNKKIKGKVISGETKNCRLPIISKDVLYQLKPRSDRFDDDQHLSFNTTASQELDLELRLGPNPISQSPQRVKVFREFL